MEEESSEPSPHLTGIVIITLPPPDNPSLGKTITAFTLSDHQRPTPGLGQPQSVPQSDGSPQNLGPQPLNSFRSFIKNSPRIVLPILGISLMLLCLWVSVSQETIFQLRDEIGDHDDLQKNKSQHAFLFPLYRKPSRGSGELGNFELKLGKPMSFERLDVTKSGGKIDSKLVSTASRIDANSVIPVRGNIYPDGYVSFFLSLYTNSWIMYLVKYALNFFGVMSHFPIYRES